MSGLFAALVSLCIISVIAGPFIYLMFFKNSPESGEALMGDERTEEGRTAMTTAQIEEIETQLGVKLPDQLKSFLVSSTSSMPDSVTVFDSYKLMIQATLDYRSGFELLPKIPSNMVYLGDELDACPYVINCDSGKILRLDKGNIESPPLQEFISFDEFKKWIIQNG